MSQEDLVKEIDDEPLWFREIERDDDDDDDEGKINLSIFSPEFVVWVSDTFDYNFGIRDLARTCPTCLLDR